MNGTKAAWLYPHFISGLCADIMLQRLAKH